MGYGQSGAAAAACAVRTPQEAVSAARQVYEAADYAALAASRELDLNDPGAEDALQGSPMVQAALAGIEAALSAVERINDWESLRGRATAEGRRWVQSLP